MDQDYPVDPLLVQVAQQQESNNDPNAVSAKGAVGVMQTMPSTLTNPGYGVTPAKDNSPQELKRVGDDYLQAMHNKYQDPNLALMAYNWGPGHVDNWLKNGSNPAQVPAETQQYVKKVNQNYQNLKLGKGIQMASNDPNAVPQSDDTPPKDLLSDYELPTAKTKAPVAQASTNSPKDLLSDYELTPQQLSAEKAKNTEQKQNSQQLPSGGFNTATAADIAKSAPTGIVKGVNEITRVPGQMYTIANQLATQASNKLFNFTGTDPIGRPIAPLTNEQQTANIRNAGNDTIGNALNNVPTVSQIGEFLGGEAKSLYQNATGGQGYTPSELWDRIKNGPETNPLLNALHQPETNPGQVMQNLTSAVPSAALFGIKPTVAMGYSGGAQIANAISPDNPFAQVVGGIAGGGIGPAFRATNWRAQPTDIANQVIQENAGGGGPPPGGGGGGVTPNSIDLQEIIPGSKPTLAEATGDPNIAVLERQRQMQDPEAFAANETRREAARQQYFEQASGTPEDVQSLRDQREAASTPLYEQAKVQPLNPDAIAPVLSKIDAAVEEVGEGSDAGKTLLGIKAKIQNALPVVDETGAVVKNKTQSPVVQIYREERDNLQKPATADGAYAATVKSTIQPIVQELGQAIESQSEPFAKAQQVYRDISPKINAAEWMQGLKLTDGTDRYTLAKVNNAYENAVRQQNAPGLNAAKNLTAEQMTTLKNLRDDLARRENVARASMPRNSTTIQNEIWNKALNQGVAGKVNKLTGGNAAGVGALGGGYLGSMVGWPSVGAFLGEHIGSKVGLGGKARATNATANLQNYLINPETYKQYLLDSQNNNWMNRFQGNLLSKP